MVGNSANFSKAGRLTSTYERVQDNSNLCEPLATSQLEPLHSNLMSIGDLQVKSDLTMMHETEKVTFSVSSVPPKSIFHAHNFRLRIDQGARVGEQDLHIHTQNHVGTDANPGCFPPGVPLRRWWIWGILDEDRNLRVREHTPNLTLRRPQERSVL